MAQWKQYSGVWTRQAQMQAAGAQNWPGVYFGDGLWVLGNNVAGQLGQSNIVYVSSPVQVGSSTTWSAVGVGYAYILAIKTDGTLWSWGANGYGYLGQNDILYRSSPVQVGSLNNWSKCASKNTTSLAIKTDGSLWSWGQNNGGQLGQNISYAIRRSSPVQVGALTTWSNIACIYISSMAIKTDGTLWSWGYNSTGELGQNDTISRSSPVQVGNQTNWAFIDGSVNQFVSAIKTDGTLWSWGYNNYGQLGQNNLVDKSSPTQIGSQTNWKVSCCGGYSQHAIKTDGTLWSWGRNNRGQLGLNIAYTVYRSSPTQVGALTTWFNISATDSSVIAIKTDGTLWAWGSNQYGQLGQNNLVDRSSPIQIGSLTNWSTPFGGGNFMGAFQKNYVPG